MCGADDGSNSSPSKRCACSISSPNKTGREDAESELTLRGALAPQEKMIHANELKRNWINGWIALEAREAEEADGAEKVDMESMN
jgi:hypothetical protein